MPLNGAVIKEGATYAPTGGTDITFSLTGERVANGIVTANMAESNFFAREKVYQTVRMPVLMPDGDFSKMKTSLRIVRPATLPSGKVVYNIVRVEQEIHPLTPTEAANLRSLAIGALADADFTQFWEAGSLT